MSLFRVVRTPGYTTIPNGTLHDTRLSFRARGLLGFLLAHPDDWEIRTSNLSEFSEGEGRDAIRTALKELITYGYVEQFKEKYLDEATRKLLWRTVTIVKDDPSLESPETGFQGSEDELIRNNSQEPSGDGFSGPLLQTLTISPSTNQKTTSSDLDPVAGVEPTQPRSRARKIYPIPAGPRPRKESARARAERERQSDDESDPFKVLLEGPDEDLPAEQGSPAPQGRPGPRTRSQGPSERLAQMFGTVARQTGHATPDVSNISALSGAFARWRREGVEDDQIRRMIENYWSSTFQRRDHLPAWQDFLAQRGSLMVTGKKSAKAAKTRANRYDASKW